VWNCLIFFLGEYSSVWPEISRVWSQIQWRFLCGISGKNHLWRIFQKFRSNQGYPLAKFVKFRSIFCNFFRVRIPLKRFTKELPYVVCTQVRRHVHKQIAERRYGEIKLGRFVFGKPVLFTLGLELTAPYSLGILVLYYYQIFVIVSIEFSLRFEPQTCPTGFAINFLFITARAERKVVCVWNCLIFFLGEYSSVWPEICRVLSQIHWRFLRGISEKNNFGRIFQKFRANQGYPLAKLVKFHPTFCIFFPGPNCAEKIHTSAFVRCLHPGKETPP